MKLVILIAMALSMAACEVNDAIKSANSIPEKLDRTNDSMDKTQEAIRLQKLAIAKQNLEDAANASVLIPVPTGLIGYAKLFAETATEEELVGQIYLYIKEVNEGVQLPNWGKDGPIEFTDAEKQEFNYRNYARVTAAQAISAFIPKEMVEEIVDVEILKDGRYRKTAMNILMLRWQFLRSTMLGASLLNEPFNSTGAVKDAVEYLGYMNDILSYGFKNEIAVKITGLKAPLKNSDEKVKDQGAVQLGDLIGDTKRMALDLQKVGPSDLTGDPAQDQALNAKHASELEVYLKELDALAARWP